MIKTIFSSIAKTLLTKLITERFLIDFVVFGLIEISKKTNNKLDDRIVGMVVDSINTNPNQPQKCGNLYCNNIVNDRQFCCQTCKEIHYYQRFDRGDE